MDERQRSPPMVVTVAELIPGVVQGLGHAREEVILADDANQAGAPNRVHELLLHPRHQDLDPLGPEPLGQVVQDLLAGRIELVDPLPVDDDVLKLRVVGHRDPGDQIGPKRLRMAKLADPGEKTEKNEQAPDDQRRRREARTAILEIIGLNAGHHTQYRLRSSFTTSIGAKAEPLSTPIPKTSRALAVVNPASSPGSSPLISASACRTSGRYSGLLRSPR